MTATTDPNTIPCPRCWGTRQVEMLIQPMVGACYIGPVRCPACSGSGRDDDTTPDEGALRAEARERVRAALPAAGEERT